MGSISEIEELNRIIRLDRENASLYLRLAVVAERNGYISRAEIALKRAWLLAPQDETVKAELARLLDWDRREAENTRLLEEFGSGESSVLSATGRIRELAAKIVEISHPDSPGALVGFAQVPGRPKWYAREAVLAAGRFRTPPAAHALLDAYRLGHAPRGLVLEAMAETGSPEVLDSLISALEVPVPHQATERLIVGIGRVATARARKFLLDRLSGGHPAEKAAVISALAYCPEESDVAKALRFVDSDSEHERAAAVELLAAVGTPDAKPLVVGRLDDEAAEVVAAAARGVAFLELGSALPRLRRLVAHWNEAARIAVSEALGAVGIQSDAKLLENEADKIGYGASASAARAAARSILARLQS